ncbi:MAG: ExbD/TolR family protein [Steroidobacteraceae bacterium]
MRPQRLRTKLRKIREQAEELAEEGGELNLIPYLDIVTNVIMFMLATTTFAAALGDINVSSPTTASQAQLQNQPPSEPKQDLNLTVSVSDKGFTIAASGAVLYQGFTIEGGNLQQPPGATLPTVPKKGAEFDYDGLARAMQQIKNSPTARNETKVIINANPDIIYDVMVQVLDACRGPLKPVADPDHPGKMIEGYERFGDVLLSAGLN